MPIFVAAEWCPLTNFNQDISIKKERAYDKKSFINIYWIPHDSEVAHNLL